MVDSGRVLLSLLAVTLLCTAVRWKDLLPSNNGTNEIIHIALGATMGVIPGMVATMRSVLLNTHSQGELCHILCFLLPLPQNVHHTHTHTPPTPSHNSKSRPKLIFLRKLPSCISSLRDQFRRG